MTSIDGTASLSVSTVGPSINIASENINNGSPNINTASHIPNDSSMQYLENTGIFDDAYDDREVGAEVDLNNLETTMNVSPISTTRIHKDHPKDQIIGDINSATQKRRMTKISKEHAMVGKRAIRTKWVYRNKKDERGIVVRNKERLVAQGYTQEEGINYDEFFAPVARIEANRLFLAYASFMGFIMYLMDVKSAFLYGTIEEEVYVCQPPGYEDLQFPDKVYKVEKALYGLHQAPKAWYETLSTYLLENRFRRGTIDKTLFIKKDQGDILLVQVYVDDIIFGSTKKSLCLEFEQIMHKRFQMSSIGELTFFFGLQTASTPMEPNKALVKDEEADNVDVHLYRSMIGSLMYLIASRPDITFVVCAYARFQVTPKVSHLHAVKRIFRYMECQPKLGLWYPRDSPFDLEAFSESDYAGASLDRKSTTGGCQFLGKRLISWQCKKQTIVANSTTEAEYVAAANCCGQVLWIQNQMLDYGFNFTTVKAGSTPIETNKALVKDEEADNVDAHLYRLMIRSLMHLTAFRPDIIVAVCACTRFQVTPKVSHLHVAKRVFRYLKGQSKLSLWYPRDSPFDLEAFSDSDYAGASLDRKSTTRVEYVAAANCCGQSRMDGRTCNIKQKYVMSQTPRQIKRGQDIKIPQSSSSPEKVGDKVVHKELGDRMERAATTASSLEAEQDSGNINRTQSMATLNESFPQGTNSDSGPRCQDTILGGVDAQTRFETTSK
ncbi:putative ribonuclease H-like domain-containing protein [Tanacetum coccineum]